MVQVDVVQSAAVRVERFEKRLPAVHIYGTKFSVLTTFCVIPDGGRSTS
jgi:hypothetical protein